MIKAATAKDGDNRRDLRRAAMIALLALVVYNANGRPMATGDSLPARFLPVALWTEGSLHLDSVLELTRGGHPNAYWILRSRDGRFGSTYPIVTPLLVAPLYGPALAYLSIGGTTADELAVGGELMEKVSASLVAATTAALLYLLLRRRVPGPSAALLTLAFAFGTNTWVTSSQALWQHGPGQLFLVVALLAVTSAPGVRSALWAGAAAGLLVANRPPDLPLGLAIAAFAAFWLGESRRRLLPLFALAMAVPIAAEAAYNLWMFDRLGGGYAVIGAAGPTFFHESIAKGIAGLLLSPGKGLLVWAPFLFVGLFVPRRCLGKDLDRVLVLCLLGGFAAQLLLYAPTDWRAGSSYGPRFLTDVLPALIWIIAPAVAGLRRWPRLVFVAAVLFSCWVQAVGAFRYQGGSDVVLHQDAQNVWRIEKTPYLLEAHSPWAPMTLLSSVFGLEEAQTYPGNWWRALRRLIGSSR